MQNEMIYRSFGPKLRYSFILAALLLGGYILVRSLTPMQASVSVPGLDKVVHLCAYLVLGVLCLPALPRVHPLFVWLGLALFGAGIEFAQGSMNAGRSGDPLDEIANMSGAGLAVLCWIIISFLWRKIREKYNSRS